MLGTSLFDRLTDCSRRGKDDGGAIALHAGADDNRPARCWTKLARIGLEAQVEFPDLLALPICGIDGVRIAAIPDSAHLARGRSFAQIHPLVTRAEAPLLGLRRLVIRNGPQV